MAAQSLEPTKFQDLVTKLLSANNEERKGAEAALKELRRDPNGLVVALVSTIRNSSTPEQSRVMCCAVLRPALVKADTLWPALTEQTREWTKRELLAAIETERSSTVLRKLSDAVSDIAAFLNDGGRGGWPELLQFTLRLTSSPDPLHRESSYGIFAQLAVLLGANVFRPHFDLIKNILSTGLADAASLKVRLAALVATASFLQVCFSLPLVFSLSFCSPTVSLYIIYIYHPLSLSHHAHTYNRSWRSRTTIL